MSQRFSVRSSLICLNVDCSQVTPGVELSLKSRSIVRKGRYFRSSDGKWISRFKCLRCNRSFSNATFSDCFQQKKRRLNTPIQRLLVSGVSQRRIAKLLRIDLKTVARKLVFLGRKANLDRMAYLSSLSSDLKRVKDVQFDELETIEKSKCLPVSVPLVVHSQSRKILSFRVGRMPAKGLLASISRKKYGHRIDERAKIVSEMFTELSSVVELDFKIMTDKNPHYPKWIHDHFPNARHTTTKGLRGCVAGQGELKKAHFDPLFSLNHTCAMLRANINRLFRKTWCTTKRIDRLCAHIEIYVQFHNQVLTS
jgi:transposase-like protein